MSNISTLYSAVIATGAACVLMGFWLVLRGIGVAEGESSIRILGAEVRTSRLAPGVMFAFLGVGLIAVAVSRVPPQAERPPTSSPSLSETKASDGRQPPMMVEPSVSGSTEAQHGPEVQLERKMAAERDVLRRVLLASADGSCPEAFMGPLLRSACEQQMPRLGQVLKAKGLIKSITYSGAEITPNGPMSTYKVLYDNGQMDWAMQLSPDGRVALLATPNIQ